MAPVTAAANDQWVDVPNSTKITTGSGDEVGGGGDSGWIDVPNMTRIEPPSVADRARKSMANRTAGGDLPHGTTANDLANPGPTTGGAALADQTGKFFGRIGDAASSLGSVAGNTVKGIVGMRGEPPRPPINAPAELWRAWGVADAAFRRAHPDIVDAVVQPTLDEYHAAHTAYMNGDLHGAVRHAIATAVPIIGPLADQTVTDIQKGDPGAVAANVGMALAGPEAVKKTGELVRSGAQGVLDARAAGAPTQYSNATGLSPELSSEMIADRTPLTNPREQLPDILQRKIDVTNNGPVTPRHSVVPQAAIDNMAENVAAVPDAPYEGNPAPNPQAAYSYAREHPGGGNLPAIPLDESGAGPSRFRSDPNAPDPTLPTPDDLNAADTAAKRVDQLTQAQTDAATAPQDTRPSKARTALTVGGAVASPLVPGGPIVHVLSELAGGGGIAKLAYDFYKSPAWQTTSAVRKAAFADALRTGNLDTVQSIAQGAATSSVIAQSAMQSPSYTTWHPDDKKAFGKAVMSGDSGAAAAAASTADQRAAGVDDPVLGAVAHLKSSDVVGLYNGKYKAMYIDPDGKTTPINAQEVTQE